MCLLVGVFVVLGDTLVLHFFLRLIIFFYVAHLSFVLFYFLRLSVRF